LDYFTIIAFVLVAVTGLAVQLKFFGQQRKYAPKTVNDPTKDKK